MLRVRATVGEPDYAPPTPELIDYACRQVRTALESAAAAGHGYAVEVEAGTRIAGDVEGPDGRRWATHEFSGERCVTVRVTPEAPRSPRTAGHHQPPGPGTACPRPPA
jgi:hypothetical protein